MSGGPRPVDVRPTPDGTRLAIEWRDGVVSTYTPADTPTTFCYGYNGEEAVTSPSCSDAGF